MPVIFVLFQFFFDSATGGHRFSKVRVFDLLYLTHPDCTLVIVVHGPTVHIQGLVSAKELDHIVHVFAQHIEMLTLMGNIGLHWNRYALRALWHHPEYRYMPWPAPKSMIFHQNWRTLRPFHCLRRQLVYHRPWSGHFSVSDSRIKAQPFGIFFTLLVSLETFLVVESATAESCFSFLPFVQAARKNSGPRRLYINVFIVFDIS